MNNVIIKNPMGTVMGTKEINLQKYLNLWDKFELSLEKEGLNLHSFAKKWDEHADGIEDYHKVYDSLKKLKRRKGNNKQVNSPTIKKLEEYIAFIDKDFRATSIRPDELFEHWFD